MTILAWHLARRRPELAALSAWPVHGAALAHQHVRLGEWLGGLLRSIADALYSALTHGGKLRWVKGGGGGDPEVQAWLEGR